MLDRPSKIRSTNGLRLILIDMISLEAHFLSLTLSVGLSVCVSVPLNPITAVMLEHSYKEHISRRIRTQHLFFVILLIIVSISFSNHYVTSM